MGVIWGLLYLGSVLLRGPALLGEFLEVYPNPIYELRGCGLGLANL